jgi:integrase
MGLYRRKWPRKNGKVMTSKAWWMSAMLDGKQVCRSTGTTNKRVAHKIYDDWRNEISQGRFNLLKKPPALKMWAEKYLKTVDHDNTRRRYACSKENLTAFFGEEARLDHISPARIEQFKQARRIEGIKAATLNRDLRFLAQILKQAERERFLSRSPFHLNKFFLNESRERRKPHIITYEEEEKILAVARPRIRVLTVLGIETGMRTGEMLGLKWKDVDLLNDVIHVEKSKTTYGIRSVPVSERCKAELTRWRNLVGPEYSEWVFPNFENRRHRLQGGRKAWATTLKKAGLGFFPIYYLRHTFASRLTTAGVSPLTIAQMLGHSSTQIVPRYAQVMDQNRLDAMRKLQELRRMKPEAQEPPEPQNNKEVVPTQQ